MSANSRQRLSARDYKHSRRGGGLNLAQYRQFALGLAVGLAAAFFVWLYGQRAQPATAVPAEPEARVAQSAVAEAEDAAEQYDFYDMLPKFEVVVPEQETGARRDVPAVPVKEPGAYVLQVASSRNQTEAERLRAKLAKQGIEANVQRVAVDENVWYRVRIGPFRDLTRLNATRAELRAADLDAILYKVGD